MIAWSIELSEFELKYEPRGHINAQCLSDFVVELTGNPESLISEVWEIYVDGSSNTEGSRAGAILEVPDGISLEQSIRFNFPASNNQAEYEALIVGM